MGESEKQLLVRKSSLNRLEKTEVWDTYWSFACERQNIFFNRISSQSSSWTSDPILLEYKFTNCYRASDRVSQYLIKNVIYSQEDYDLENVFFRIMLFKLFNKIETWRLLERELGEISLNGYSFDKYDAVLSSAKEKKRAIYSGAYIMPSAKSVFGYSQKHKNHLRLLEYMISDKLPNRLSKAKSMKEAFILIKAYPSIGDFLAYQYVTDINYSEITDFSEMEFVVAGPGAKDGIRKCVGRTRWNESDVIRATCYTQQEEFDRLGLKFKSLWGRPLQLIDCQNLFCEVDKYSRVAHPKVEGISKRKRIKQKFSSNGLLPKPFYPPKWGINDKIEEEFKENLSQISEYQTANVQLRIKF